MLIMDDIDSNPNTITVAYPLEMFGISRYDENESLPEGLSDLDYKQEEIGTKAIEYEERIWYLKKRSDVIRVTGSVDPYSQYNNGETFQTFHEREIYMNTDGEVVEFISQFDTTGKVYVWVAIHSDHEWVTDWDWLLIDVTDSLQRIEYYFYMDQPGEYDIWLKDTKTGNWYYRSYDEPDNPTFIYWLTGSTEIDTRGGISKKFDVYTYPLTTDYCWCKDENDWCGDSGTAEEAFKYFKKDPDQPYVYVHGWFDDSGRLITFHISSDDV